MSDLTLYIAAPDVERTRDGDDVDVSKDVVKEIAEAEYVPRPGDIIEVNETNVGETETDVNRRELRAEAVRTMFNHVAAFGEQASPTQAVIIYTKEVKTDGR